MKEVKLALSSESWSKGYFQWIMVTANDRQWRVEENSGFVLPATRVTVFHPEGHYSHMLNSENYDTHDFSNDKRTQSVAKIMNLLEHFIQQSKGPFELIIQI